MVVEDHADSCTALAMFLSSIGHRVVTTGDSGQAFPALSHTKVEVLLADVLLPEVSAWELLRNLKADGYLPPYVVTMSAMHPWEVVHLSRAAGCHDHLTKPFGVEKLVATLERACASVH